LIHTHNAGGHLPSGAPIFDNLNDYGVLNWIADRLQAAGYSRSLARIYIAADTVWNEGDPPQQTVINVYDQTNIIPAIDGSDVVGPEVNPDGQPCPL
jgi:hypothetical protein